MRHRYFIGLDLGKRRDHSAIAIVELVERQKACAPAQAAAFEGLMVRYLERMPLGTGYPDVVERMREITSDYWLRGQCAVAVDATGVGEPVMDMLRAAKLGCEMVAVTITGGAKESESGSTWMAPRCAVPKRDLMAGVQVLLEAGELKIAGNLREAGALVKELLDIRVTRRERGKVRIGAEGAGEHDDLAIALALAVWKSRRVRPMAGLGGGLLPGVCGF